MHVDQFEPRGGRRCLVRAVVQIVELVRQLRGEAEGRQVEGAKTGLAVNFGGFGNNVVSTILTTK